MRCSLRMHARGVRRRRTPSTHCNVQGDVHFHFDQNFTRADLERSTAPRLSAPSNFYVLARRLPAHPQSTPAPAPRLIDSPYASAACCTASSWGTSRSSPSPSRHRSGRLSPSSRMARTCTTSSSCRSVNGSRRTTEGPGRFKPARAKRQPTYYFKKYS